jgi:hypothetical protein
MNFALEVIFWSPANFNMIKVGKYIPGVPVIVCCCTLSIVLSSDSSTEEDGHLLPRICSLKRSIICWCDKLKLWLRLQGQASSL